MLIRKCAFCNGEIQVDLPYSKKYVYYKPKNKWYHADCFTAVTTPRILNGDWFHKTELCVKQEVPKDNIDKLFKKHYGVSYIPKYIYIKLDSIYKGTLKGLAQPIPPIELLDILERKQDYIDKCLSSKGITDVPAINYALAVAIGSYKSYKEWLAKCAAEQEIAKQEAENRQGYSYKLKGYVPPNEPEKENTFIDLDEE